MLKRLAEMLPWIGGNWYLLPGSRSFSVSSSASKHPAIGRAARFADQGKVVSSRVPLRFAARRSRSPPTIAVGTFLMPPMLSLARWLTSARRPAGFFPAG